MLKRILENLAKMDWILLTAVFMLFFLGLAAIYSVNLSQADEGYDNFKKQILFAVIGLVFMLILGLSNYAGLRVYSRLLWLVCFVLLILVLFVGSVVHGTQGWLSLGSFNIQPVELAKVVLIIVLAKFFSNRLQNFTETKHIIVSLILCLSLAVPVLLQPDLGSAAVLLGIWFIMLLLTGIRKRTVLLLFLLLAVVAVMGWTVFLKDYQKERIMVFLDPQSDPLGSGYNVTQSVIAIGSGKIWGRGLGFGSQSQLKFIPEAQTDFIFAVIAEELGLFGVFLVVFLWALIFYRLLLIAKGARDDFGMFLVLGVMSIFFWHLMINMGMNMGIMPVMGISLPFLSYGGSFLIVAMLLVGMAQSVKIKS